MASSLVIFVAVCIAIGFPVRGATTVGAEPAPSIPVDSTQKIALDIDGDGDLDYVLEGSQESGRHRLEIWLNQGRNRWKSQGFIFTSIAAPDLMAADLNHDGYADLVVRDRNSQRLPEIWVGGRRGLLEKSKTDFPLSMSLPEETATPGAPEDLKVALLFEDSLSGGCRHSTQGQIVIVRPEATPGILLAAAPLRTGSVTARHVSPRGPPPTSSYSSSI